MSTKEATRANVQIPGNNGSGAEQEVAAEARKQQITKARKRTRVGDSKDEHEV
jgi:hypothetical protein